MDVSSSAKGKPVRLQGLRRPPLRPTSAQNEAEGGVLHPRLHPKFTFGAFVSGPTNQGARAAVLAVAERPGGKSNPLLILGGVGLGKTHLATATGHHLWNSSLSPGK